MALEKGIAPETAFQLLGLDADMDDGDRLDMFTETVEGARLDERQQFAKSHGVKPHFSLGKSTALTYEEILKLEDSEIQKLPDSMITRAMDEVKRPNRKTLRNRLKNWGSK